MTRINNYDSVRLGCRTWKEVRVVVTALFPITMTRTHHYGPFLCPTTMPYNCVSTMPYDCVSTMPYDCVSTMPYDCVSTMPYDCVSTMPYDCVVFSEYSYIQRTPAASSRLFVCSAARTALSLGVSFKLSYLMTRAGATMVWADSAVSPHSPQRGNGGGVDIEPRLQEPAAALSLCGQSRQPKPRSESESKPKPKPTGW
jgi:hypothetical protein